MAKVRVALRMEEGLKNQIDKIAQATGKDRTEIIEKFCLSGIAGMQRLIEQRKKENQEPLLPEQ